MHAVAGRWYVVCKACGENNDLNERFVPPALKGIHPVDGNQKEAICCENCGSTPE